MIYDHDIITYTSRDLLVRELNLRSTQGWEVADYSVCGGGLTSFLYSALIRKARA